MAWEDDGFFRFKVEGKDSKPPEAICDSGADFLHPLLRGEHLGGKMKPRLHVEHVTPGLLLYPDMHKEQLHQIREGNDGQFLPRRLGQKQPDRFLSHPQFTPGKVR
jgi:hypothetical protein